MAGKVIKLKDVDLLANDTRTEYVRGTLNKDTIPSISISAGWFLLSPGSTIGIDVHDKDEIYFIKSGEARLLLDGDETLICAGDTVFVPAGCEHNLINENEVAFELFWLFPSPLESGVVTASGEPRYRPASQED